MRKVALVLEFAGLIVILGPGLSSDASAVGYVIFGLLLIVFGLVTLWVSYRRGSKRTM